MRIHPLGISPILVGIMIFLVLACESRPEHEKLPDHVFLPVVTEEFNQGQNSRALWFTTSNSVTGGRLGRLDLQTGAIDRSIKTIPADAVIFPDAQQGLFLLNRLQGDGISVLKGEHAHVSAFYSLAKGSNPQQALRDPQGRVWVTLQESNEVLVLSSDLKQKIGSVRLDALKVSEAPQAVADLAQIYQIDEEHLWVTAQRFRRSVRAWTPDPLSGLAVINLKSLLLETIHLLPLPNPIQIGRSENKILIVGGGDFSMKDGLTGKVASFAREQGVEPTFTEMPGKILAADLSVELAAPALIVWYPSENKSCVQRGEFKILCEGNALNEGYVFNAIRQVGSRLFVAYQGGGVAQLWMITKDEASSLQKIPMDLPIMSLSGGL